MFRTNFGDVGRMFDTFRELERMSRVLSRVSTAAVNEFPAANVWSNPEGAVVSSEIPGVDPGEIEISVTGKTLTLKGARQPEELKEGEAYHRRERWYGTFSKTIDLPFEVDAEHVQAKYSRGVLTISLPRAAAEKPKKIEIKAA